MARIWKLATRSPSRFHSQLLYELGASTPSLLRRFTSSRYASAVTDQTEVLFAGKTWLLFPYDSVLFLGKICLG